MCSVSKFFYCFNSGGGLTVFQKCGELHKGPHLDDFGLSWTSDTVKTREVGRAIFIKEFLLKNGGGVRVWMNNSVSEVWWAPYGPTLNAQHNEWLSFCVEGCKMQGFLFCLTSREAESSGIRLLKPQTVEEFRCYLFLDNRIFW